MITISSNKKHYDGGDITIISSQPSEYRKKYVNEKMADIKKSSEQVLDCLKKIEKDYPNK